VGRVGQIGRPDKAFRPTSRNLDLDSNVTEESDPQSAKQHSSKTSTNEGRRMISTKPVPKKAFFSIRHNLDLNSKLTEESYSHFENHSSLKTSID
jgi:hypothetical protein